MTSKLTRSVRDAVSVRHVVDVAAVLELQTDDTSGESVFARYPDES